MSGPPCLRTERIVLRPFSEEDAADVQRLAGEREIARNTLTVPHPYPLETAVEWIASHRGAWERGEGAVFAICRFDPEEVVGAMGISLTPAHRRGELGYWVGKPFWGSGLASEAGRSILRFAFGELGLRRVCAHHYSRNPASGRVLQKIGMRHEGRLRQHVLKDGVFEDLETYGVLAEELQPD